MAKKGETKSEKRLATSTVRKLKRKEKKFTIRSKPGPHKRENSVPLGFVLRELLGKAKNLKEAKFILKNRNVKVDGIVRTDYCFPVGLFDVVSFDELKEQYVMLFDVQGRLVGKKIDAKDASAKLCRVELKRTIKKGIIQITTNDGRNFLEKKTALRVGDSILIQIPKQKILEEIELKKGNTAYIIGGSYVGKTAKIRDISEGSIKRKKLVALKPERDAEFETSFENVFAVGKQKPALNVLKVD